MSEMAWMSGAVGVVVGATAMVLFAALVAAGRGDDGADDRRAERDRAAVQRIEKEKKEGGRE